MGISQPLSQSIFNNSPSAIIIYDVMGKGESSDDYIIKSVNKSCLKIEKWDMNKVLGKSLKEVRPGVDEFGIVKVFHQVFESGETAHYPAKVYKGDQGHRWFENTVFKLPTGEIVAVYTDVTDEKQAREELYEEKERLKVTLYSIGDGVISTDKYGKVEVLNKVAEQLTGWSRDEAKGQELSTVFNIYNEITGEPIESPVQKVLRKGVIVGLANHTALRNRNGEEMSIADSAAPIRNKDGEIMGVVLVFRDVTEAKEKEKRIEFLRYRDTLTGLYNRAYFENEVKRLQDPGYMPLTFIMGDLDGLKLINDVFGHQTGDKALKKVAKIIKASCRESDMIFRWGGDEFVILLPKTPENVGIQICERIKKRCLSTKVISTGISISLGCASKTEKGEKWHDVLKKAEDYMYKSKLLGTQSYRNTVLISIKNALFEKSYETEEHGERLGNFCRAVGERMNLPSFQIDELEVLAMLHDIGKIATDNQILEKPGKLTEEEMKVIRKHPEVGYRICQAVPELLNIAEYILAHHERWDGTGYPRGLAGEKIPILSRILAVADAYDAMTQNRPYRKAITAEEAMSELRKNAGTQFDPQIVQIFLEYLK